MGLNRKFRHDPLSRYVRHFSFVLVGNIRVRDHGYWRFLREFSASLLVIPAAGVFSLWLYFRRRETYVYIARNGHAQASFLIHDFEPLKRMHLNAEFGDADVVFVAQVVPVGPALWLELTANSKLRIAKWSRIYRCIFPNRYVHRRYLPISEDHTCLLYTSPSPRDLSTSRMPSSA